VSRRRRQRGGGASLDSFLDIVTNVVGGLILIAVVTVLGAGDIKVNLGTPVLHAAPKEAERVVLECRGGRVAKLPVKAAMDRIEQALAVTRGEQIDVRDFDYLLGSRDFGDALFRVKVRLNPEAGTVFMAYEPRAEEQGEDVATLRRDGSEYRQLLKRLDPRAHYLFFIVREDGFDVFREARALARARGFAVGWHPRPRQEPLLFSEHGRVGTDIQ